MSAGLRKASNGLRKVSDSFGKVSYVLVKVSDGLRKVSDNLGKVSDGLKLSKLLFPHQVSFKEGFQASKLGRMVYAFKNIIIGLRSLE